MCIYLCIYMYDLCMYMAKYCACNPIEHCSGMKIALLPHVLVYAYEWCGTAIKWGWITQNNTCLNAIKYFAPNN